MFAPLLDPMSCSLVESITDNLSWGISWIETENVGKTQNKKQLMFWVWVASLEVESEKLIIWVTEKVDGWFERNFSNRVQ